MANYNTFHVMDCKSRKCIVSTSSAKKAKKMLEKGKRVDIWNNNELVKTVYEKTKHELDPYVRIEKEYIARKQKMAEERNKQRRMKRLARQAI